MGTRDDAIAPPGYAWNAWYGEYRRIPDEFLARWLKIVTDCSYPEIRVPVPCAIGYFQVSDVLDELARRGQVLKLDAGPGYSAWGKP